jgi:putative flavoprotein involved in K+ transport
MTSSQHYDVVVIGGGQAGLAMGHFLARESRRFVILEAGDAVGTAWRARWDSLLLFSPRRYSSLPGLEFPGDPEGYPTRDEVVAYLEKYAETFALPIELNTRVRSLGRSSGRYVVDVGAGRLETDQVVVATGPFQVPNVPAFARELAPELFQPHSTGYRKPSDAPQGTVLVVGGGNTGYQIAKELSATRTVHLAVGSRQKRLPQRLFGRDVFWWLTKTGLIKKTVHSRLGSRLRGQELLIGSSPRKLVRRHGVQLRPRVVAAQGRAVTFADNSELEVDGVIWATGYRPDHSWIELPVFGPDGRVRHERGESAARGVYFLGLAWQYTRGSALIGFVKDDAEFISRRIEETASQEMETTDRPPARELAGLTEGI